MDKPERHILARNPQNASEIIPEHVRLAVRVRCRSECIRRTAQRTHIKYLFNYHYTHARSIHMYRCTIYPYTHTRKKHRHTSTVYRPRNAKPIIMHLCVFHYGGGRQRLCTGFRSTFCLIPECRPQVPHASLFTLHSILDGMKLFIINTRKPI